MGYTLRILQVTFAFLITISDAHACEAKIIENSNNIGFSGCLSEESATILIEAIKRNPRNLVVQSEGGGVEAGLKIANELQKYNLSVIVRGYCYSSCANYLLSAKEVVLEDNSIIAFHGDAQTSLAEYLSKNYKDILLFQKLSEFSSIEVKLGKMVPKIAYIHSLQNIAMGHPDQKYPIEFTGKSYLCIGLGQLPWIPSSRVLTRLNIIQRITPVNDQMVPEIKFNKLNIGITTSDSDKNPMESCVEVFN